MSHLIWIYTVCRSDFEFWLTSSFTAIVVSNIKDRRTHFRKSGMKGVNTMAMQKHALWHMQTAKAQIRLRCCAVWSGHLLSANRIIWHYRMYQWIANARMRLRMHRMNRNQCILHMFEGTFWLEAANTYYPTNILPISWVNSADLAWSKLTFVSAVSRSFCKISSIMASRLIWVRSNKRTVLLRNFLISIDARTSMEKSFSGTFWKYIIGTG